MKPLERLTCRVAFGTGIIAFGAMACLALSSPPAAAENNDTAVQLFPVRVTGATSPICPAYVREWMARENWLT